jgi:hypothetical protein
MKYIITESRINNLIEKYILDKYPMVRNVTFTKDLVNFVNHPDDKGYETIEQNVMNINFINGKMTHSPSYLTRLIRNDINPMFGLEIGRGVSEWRIDYKMVKK